MGCSINGATSALLLADLFQLAAREGREGVLSVASFKHAFNGRPQLASGESR